MRIGIYANMEIGTGGGIQQYTEKLIKALAECTNNDVFIITNNDFKHILLKQIGKNSNLHFIIKHDFLFDLNKVIEKKGLEILHAPYEAIFYNNLAIPIIISMHDLQHEYYPEYFTEQEIKNRKYYYKKASVLCDGIIVSFSHVKNDIVKYLQVPPNRITVTSLGEENRFNDCTLFSIDYLCNKFKMSKEFILYPANTWEHKNHITLLRALKYINEVYNENIFLVCTGFQTPYFKSIQKYLLKSNLSAQVCFTGYIELDELYSLYKHTSLVVIPTLYEAGSFPLLEAMSIGAPVICSNVTTLPETIGNRDFTFSPKDYKELAELIVKMHRDKEFIRLNIHNSVNEIKRYSWESCVDNFTYAYKQAIKNFKRYKTIKKMYKQRIIFSFIKKERGLAFIVRVVEKLYVVGPIQFFKLVISKLSSKFININ